MAKKDLGPVEVGPDEITGTPDVTEKEKRFVAAARKLYREFEQDCRWIHDKCRHNDARYYDSFRPDAGSASVFDQISAKATRDGTQCTFARYPDPLTEATCNTIPTVTPVLHSVTESLCADLMQSQPDPVILANNASFDRIAQTVTAFARAQRDRSGYCVQYRNLIRRMLVRGGAVMMTEWDNDALRGRGDVGLREIDYLRFFHDPACVDFQDGRACFATSMQHLSWYKQHYPDKYEGIEGYAEEQAKYDTSVAAPEARERQVELLEYWYRVYESDPNIPGQGRYRVHLAKIAGNQLLECSEEGRPDGIYDHGRYPFTLYRYLPVEGTPWFIGLVDLYAAMQDYIDYADYAAARSMLFSATAKLLMNENAITDKDQVTDWRKIMVEIQGAPDDALKWFQAAPFNGLNVQQSDSKIGLLKDLTGQNAFNRGEGGRGVTAATAIMALQEAGSKVSSMFRDQVFGYEREVVDQQIELTRQFYMPGRTARERAGMGTGNADQDRQLYEMDASQWVSFQGMRYTSDDAEIEPIEFDVTIRIQRMVNFSSMQQNELLLSLLQMMLQAGVPVDPTAVIGQMIFDGKEAFMGNINNGLMAQLQQMQQQLAETQQIIQNQQAELEGMRQIAAGQKPDAKAEPVAPSSRGRAQNVEMPDMNGAMRKQRDPVQETQTKRNSVAAASE